MKNVLVTGGSGYVGRKLISKLLNTYPDISVTSLSRSEGVISQLLMDCPDPRLKIEMCDVRDFDHLKEALKGKDTVIHLAAMKRVDLSEEKSQEAVTINVNGTLNMLKAFHGSTFVLMSTDKAVEPVNCYGATKLVAEKLVMEQAHKPGQTSRFMVVRAGNIMGSTGSVLDIWKHQIQEKNEITVTDPNMVRYYTTSDNVGELIMAVLQRGQNGKIYFTPHDEPIVLGDMIDKAINLFGNGETKIKIVGLRPGERMSEKMYGETEANDVIGYESIVIPKAH